MSDISSLKDQELADLIRYHNEKYFNEEAEITDAEFDSLVVEMERRNPEDSVLSEVGATPSYGKKVKHSRLMGSLNKIHYDRTTKDIHTLENWYKYKGDEKGVVVMPKIDGLAVRLVYENGNLVLAATRGNGFEGQDVTDNVKQIRTIPKHIDTLKKIEVRGEIFMHKSIFQLYRKRTTGKVPANPRNMASGLLNHKDPKKTSEIPLNFSVYDYFPLPPKLTIETEQQKANHIKKLSKNFNYVETSLVQRSELSMYISSYQESRKHLDYNIDGLVFAVNNLARQEKLGYKGKCPVGKIAFKFPPEQMPSVIENIDWQLGRTGRLTPVAKIRPINLDGSTIDSPTLHNLANIRSKDVCIDDEVVVEKAGDIIPQIVRRSKKGSVKHKDRKHKSVINYPKVCPVCFQPTQIDEKEVNVWCTNPLCAGQAEHRIIYFLQTVGAEGIGPGIVTSLVTNNKITGIDDLYDLTVEDIKDIPGFGEKSATNVINAINTIKEITFAVFIQSLGISGIGKTNAESIADKYVSVEKLMIEEIELEDLIEIEGFGKTLANNFINHLENIRDMIKILTFEKGVTITPMIPVPTSTKSLEGKSFCITGKLSIGRKEMAAEIKECGGIIKSSVSKGLDYLVAGDDVGATKISKAEKYGTKVISEEEIREMMSK